MCRVFSALKFWPIRLGTLDKLYWARRKYTWKDKVRLVFQTHNTAWIDSIDYFCLKIPTAKNMKLKSKVGMTTVEVRFFIGRNRALVY